MFGCLFEAFFFYFAYFFYIYAMVSLLFHCQVAKGTTCELLSIYVLDPDIYTCFSWNSSSPSRCLLPLINLCSCSGHPYVFFLEVIFAFKVLITFLLQEVKLVWPIRFLKEEIQVLLSGLPLSF